MIRHGLRPARIFGERRRRDIELPGQPLNQRLDRLLQLRQGDAGMTKQGELNGKADPIGIPPPGCHEFLIGAR